MSTTIGLIPCHDCNGTGLYDEKLQGEPPVDPDSGLCEWCAGEKGLQPFLNVYLESREYGGPEEGGWWYNTGSPLASIPVSPEMPMDEMAELKAKLSQRFSVYDGKYDLGSVLGTTKLCFKLEPHFAESWPAVTPFSE